MRSAFVSAMTRDELRRRSVNSATACGSQYSALPAPAFQGGRLALGRWGRSTLKLLLPVPSGAFPSVLFPKVRPLLGGAGYGFSASGLCRPGRWSHSFAVNSSASCVTGALRLPLRALRFSLRRCWR